MTFSTMVRTIAVATGATRPSRITDMTELQVREGSLNFYRCLTELKKKTFQTYQRQFKEGTASNFQNISGPLTPTKSPVLPTIQWPILCSRYIFWKYSRLGTVFVPRFTHSPFSGIFCPIKHVHNPRGSFSTRDPEGPETIWNPESKKATGDVRSQIFIQFASCFPLPYETFQVFNCHLVY